MKNKKLLVFNLGGALLMPTDEVIKIWCDAIRSIGLNPDYSKIYLNYEKSYADVVIPEMAAEQGWSQVQLDSVFKLVNKKFHDINTNNTLELATKLKKLSDNGYELGVITDQSINSLVKGLNKIGLTLDLFHFVSTSDDGFKKPDTRVLSKMIKKYHPLDILLIGQDYHKECIMAQKSGVDFVPITSLKFSYSFWKSVLGQDAEVYNLVSDFVDDFLKD